MRHSAQHCVPRQRQRETKEAGKAKNSERQQEIETYSLRERHCRTREEAANEECSNAGGHWHPLSWHASMPSCRIYPGALGLHYEKTQLA